MSLLQELGRAYLCLSKYECHKVLEILSQLPPHHYGSGWVQSCLGRAYFELAQYEQVPVFTPTLTPFFFISLTISFPTRRRS